MTEIKATLVAFVFQQHVRVLEDMLVHIPADHPAYLPLRALYDFDASMAKEVQQMADLIVALESKLRKLGRSGKKA